MHQDIENRYSLFKKSSLMSLEGGLVYCGTIWKETLCIATVNSFELWNDIEKCDRIIVHNSRYVSRN